MKIKWKFISPSVGLFLLQFALFSPALGAEIEIRGTEKFQTAVSNALILLRTKAPDAYQIVTNNIAIIDESDHSGMNAGAVHPAFNLNGRSAFYSPTWCASDIAHDSFHSKLYHDYQKAHAGKVPDEIWIGHEAELKCLQHQARVLKAVGAPAYEISYCGKISPDYAGVPYTNRNW
jgi:hypothetical protein